MYKYAFVALLISNAAAASPTGNAAHWQAAIAELTANKACQADADCDSAPMGYRACGGPDAFVVYSKRQTSRKRLKAALRKFTELDKKAKAGLTGICSVEIQPAVGCVSGQCVRK
jgi:hypothetical protein